MYLQESVNSFKKKYNNNITLKCSQKEYCINMTKFLLNKYPKLKLNSDNSNNNILLLKIINSYIDSNIWINTNIENINKTIIIDKEKQIQDIINREISSYPPILQELFLDFQIKK